MPKQPEFSKNISSCFEDEAASLIAAIDAKNTEEKKAIDLLQHAQEKETHTRDLLSFYKTTSEIIQKVDQDVKNGSGMVAGISKLIETSVSQISEVKKNTADLTKAMNDVMASYQATVTSVSTLETRVSTRQGHSDPLSVKLAKDEQTFETLGKQIGTHTFNSTKIALDSISIGPTFEFSITSGFLDHISESVGTFRTTSTSEASTLEKTLSENNIKTQQTIIERNAAQSIHTSLSSFKSESLQEIQDAFEEGKSQASEKSPKSKSPTPSNS